MRVSAESTEIELAEVGVPSLNKDEVLVAVKAFGVGVHDRYFIPPNVTFPFPIGSEGSGVVEKIGSEVTDFKKGDRVIFSSSMQIKGGSWAEFTVVSDKSLQVMPNNMDFEEGTALPVAGKTAMESIRALNLKRGDTLFVAGASGAIGSFVIQLANKQGIHVVGSASFKNQDYLLSLGAKKAVDYRNPNWKKEILQWQTDGVDAALAIQSGTAKDSMDVVKNGGKVITVSGDDVYPERDILLKQFQHQLSLQEVITDLSQKIVTGEIKVIIEQVYPFEEAIQALEKSETRHARGKLVVSLKGK